MKSVNDMKKIGKHLHFCIMSLYEVYLQAIHLVEKSNMSKSYFSRALLCLALLTALIFVSGCPNATLVCPERINYNIFTIPQQWSEKNISLIEVYEEAEDSEPSKEPVWSIRATGCVSAEKFILNVGVVPSGFKQTRPLMETFEPVDGKKYYIMVRLEPSDENTFFAYKPWIASSVKQIGPPEDDDSPYTHQNSKMQFPKYVGLFERAGINCYDTTEDDISIEYYRPPVRGLAEITIYIYPCDDTGDNNKILKKDFESCKDAIEGFYQEVKIISEGEIHITQEANTCKGLGVVYSINKQTALGTQPVISKLFLFNHGRWFFKYRITYLEEMDYYVGTEVRQFMNELKWPEL